MNIRFISLLPLVLGFVLSASANSGTWTGGADGSWTDNSNWDTSDYPGADGNVTTDNATFGNVTGGNVALDGGSISLDSIIFNGTAGNYNITISGGGNMAFLGEGVNNTSGNMQNFTVTGSVIYFDGNASAGDNVTFTANGSSIIFSKNSNAGNSILYADSSSSIYFGYPDIDTANYTENTTIDPSYAGAGNSSITIEANGAMYFYSNSSAENASITNNGAIHFGAGISIAENATTGTNATVINSYASAGNATIDNGESGSISFHTNSTLANATIYSNGTVSFADNSTAAYGNIIAVSNPVLDEGGNLTVDDDGNVSFNTTASVTFSGNSNAGSANITLDNATLTFNGNSNGGNAIVVGENSTITIDATGSETGLFTIGSISGSGNLIVGGNSSLESGINVVEFTNPNEDVDLGNFIISDGSAMGSIKKVSGGNLILGEENSYTGYTIIGDGTVKISHSENSLASTILDLQAGGKLGYVDNATITNNLILGGLAGDASVTLDIASGNYLILGAHDWDAVYNGTLTGAGEITKEGESMWTLAGDSSLFAGNTTITAGTIALAGNANMGGDIYVDAGVLSALGESNATVSRVTLNGGRLEVNNFTANADTGEISYGSMRAGNITVTDGEILIGASRNATTDTITFGQLTVNGTLDLGERDRLKIDISGSSDYFIGGNRIEGALLAGNVSIMGEDGNATAGLNMGDAIPSDLSNAMQFQVVDNSTVSDGKIKYTFEVIQLPFRDFVYTPNQKAVADLMNEVVDRTGGENEIILTLNNRVHGRDLPNAMDRLGPATIGLMSKLAFDAMKTDIRVVDERMMNWRADHGEGVSVQNMSEAVFTVSSDLGSFRVPASQLLASTNPGAPAMETIRPDLNVLPWAVYAVGYFGGGNVDADNNAIGYTQTSRGINLGVERRFGTTVVTGLQLGYSYNTADHEESSGRVRAKSLRGLAYAGWSNGKGPYAHAYGRYAKYDFDDERRFLDWRAEGKTNGDSYGGMFSIGYDWKAGVIDEWRTGPVLRLSYESLSVDGFEESGDITRMTVDSHTAKSLRSNLGWHVSWEGLDIVDNRVWIIDARVGWQHEFKNDPVGIRAQFSQMPDAGSVLVHGNDIPTNSISAGIGLQWFYSQRMRFSVDYDIELSSKEINNTGRVGFTFRF